MKTQRIYLIPFTEEAAVSLGHRDHLELDKFPFRFGRESRRKKAGDTPLYRDRRRPGCRPNNDFYLFDLGKYLNISREHFQIDRVDEKYYISDRGSTCGTIINSRVSLKDAPGKRHELQHGDTITVGKPDSRYIYTLTISS
ncbi:MAG: FHA domain-containing protein [Chitinivibrionales bacterium]